MADFAHTARANASRRVKARRIAVRALLDGITPHEFAQRAGLDDDAAFTRARVTGAGYDHASPETLRMAADMLLNDPPRFAHDRPHVTTDPTSPPCSCRPLGDAGQLWELPGWPCPHPWPNQAPGGVIVCGRRGGKTDPGTVDAIRQLGAAATQHDRDLAIAEEHARNDDVRAGHRSPPLATVREHRGAWWDL